MESLEPTIGNNLYSQEVSTAGDDEFTVNVNMIEYDKVWEGLGEPRFEPLFDGVNSGVWVGMWEDLKC